MKRYTIERVYLSTQTLGSWYDGEEVIAKTIELPWRENHRSQDWSKASCIPEKVYLVKKQAPKPTRQYGHFKLINTEPRQGILVHRITNVESLLGCIGVATRFLNIDMDADYEGIESSKKLEWMYQNLPDEFELEIKKKPTTL